MGASIFLKNLMCVWLCAGILSPDMPALMLLLAARASDQLVIALAVKTRRNDPSRQPALEITIHFAFGVNAVPPVAGAFAFLYDVGWQHDRPVV